MILDTLTNFMNNTRYNLVKMKNSLIKNRQKEAIDCEVLIDSLDDLWKMLNQKLDFDYEIENVKVSLMTQYKKSLLFDLFFHNDPLIQVEFFDEKFLLAMMEAQNATLKRFSRKDVFEMGTKYRIAKIWLGRDPINRNEIINVDKKLQRM